jgi:hypothetical protein
MLSNFRLYCSFGNALESSGLVREFKEEADLAQRAQQAIELDVRGLRKNLPKQQLPSMKREAPTEGAEEVPGQANSVSEKQMSTSEPASGETSISDTSVQEHNATNTGGSSDRPSNLRKFLTAFVIAAISIIILVITAIVAYQTGQQQPYTPGTATTSPSASETPAREEYVLDLNWYVEPENNSSRVISGLATLDDQRYPNSFTHEFCDNTTIDLLFLDKYGVRTDYDLLTGWVAGTVRNSAQAVTVSIYITKPTNSDWILLDRFTLSSKKKRGLMENLPNGTTALRFSAKGPCSVALTWADLKVRQA